MRRALSTGLASGLIVGVLATIAAPSVVSASESVTVSNTLPAHFEGIPVLPKMDVGFRPDVFGRSTSDRLGKGPFLIDFGTRTVVNPASVRRINLISPRAVWASGAYGWTHHQRDSFDANVLVSPRLAKRINSMCAESASLVCAMDAVPGRLKAPVAAELVVAAVRHRLAMTTDEKQRLEVGVDLHAASTANELVTITTTSAPALPTTDGASTAGRTVTADLFGLLAPPAWNSAPTVPYGTLRLWDSGVQWRDIEPSPGRFEWRVLDHAIQVAESRRAKVLLVLGPTPRWASSEPDIPDESWGSGAGGPLTPSGTAAFERYVTAVVKRYGDRIWGYETWNEANLPTFWRGSPAQMAMMTKIVHDAVQSNDAHSKVLSASATTRTEGSIYRFLPSYLNELSKRGWPVDGFAVHAYPDADGTPSDSIDAVAQFKAYLAIAGAPALPIFNTEVNYGLAGPGPDKPHRDMTSEQSQGWISRTFIDAVRMGVEETHWFAWSPKYYGQYGVQLNPQSDANRRAWQTTYDWIVGSTFLSCSSPEGAVLCEFTRDGKPFWLAYADSNELIDLPAGASQWCDLRGACSPTAGSKVIVGVRPVRLM